MEVRSSEQRYLEACSETSSRLSCYPGVDGALVRKFGRRYHADGRQTFNLNIKWYRESDVYSQIFELLWEFRLMHFTCPEFEASNSFQFMLERQTFYC